MQPDLPRRTLHHAVYQPIDSIAALVGEALEHRADAQFGLEQQRAGFVEVCGPETSRPGAGLPIAWEAQRALLGVG